MSVQIPFHVNLKDKVAVVTGEAVFYAAVSLKHWLNAGQK